jgi:hypothetical protein
MLAKLLYGSPPNQRRPAATIIRLSIGWMPALQFLLFSSSTCKFGASRSTSLLKEDSVMWYVAVSSPVCRNITRCSFHKLFRRRFRNLYLLSSFFWGGDGDRSIIPVKTTPQLPSTLSSEGTEYERTLFRIVNIIMLEDRIGSCE